MMLTCPKCDHRFDVDRRPEPAEDAYQSFDQGDVILLAQIAATAGDTRLQDQLDVVFRDVPEVVEWLRQGGRW